ncbi:hypothetical protein [Lysobacter silvisoli]|uniref:Signal transduction histidine kinase dimerisation/phosphoacceptor domain-containing protein n=1 Tax=Lysobacter silvisoli TaxID=2293254 RepID=A0A371K3Q8_9GAMM|nr:hypothetical protein [Lysobacter silvisoli]RDZ28566.1 hypothetical protein DX914_05405 [Lysobacter silvisoli]
MSDPPSLPTQNAPAPNEGDYARWLHGLRNELSAVLMACAAADAVLASGDLESTRRNLRRAADACARGTELLRKAPRQSSD